MNILLAAVKEENLGNFLVVQWLGPRTSTAGGTGSIPGQGTKIPQAVQPKKKKKRKKEKNLKLSSFGGRKYPFSGI